MKYLVVGGDWNDEGGKPSGYVRKLFDAMIAIEPDGKLENGGTFDDLCNVYERLAYVNVVFWFPQVPNDKHKMVEDIKKIHPEIILVTSKRNNDEYSIIQIIHRALKTKSNLVLNFQKHEHLRDIEASIIDPLGNQFGPTSKDINDIARCLMTRVAELTKFTRIGSKGNNEMVEVPDMPEFFEVVRNYGGTFHQLIHGANTDRFLGNASFRCESGFPSFKANGLIYVSRRNIDKRGIGRDGFVAVHPVCKDVVFFNGDVKPSVDTPIQLRLYNYYPNIRYMLHAHVYCITEMTYSVIPCGAMEEFYEIIKMYPYRELREMRINLKGHGSIVMADNVGFIKDTIYKARIIPEVHVI